ncbi:thioredoxin family protein [Mycoplasmopsis citelli]|uniref:Thioredoxin n=1 Tax=Mycoplasmopsis citelli TaxID=171281 RepID=A0A449B255_9BACT|nr:thioredoxin family protein [Mycoplasmopsis citelli]UUD36192.1 thioredoxin family protein [Mycoplasmopsis citelli]VEU74687.1 Thioredoxin [Mycoplasmopsis citelli]
MVKDSTKNEVLETVKSGFHLVVFHAKWCGMCKMFGPVLEELAQKDKVSVLKVDVDNEKEYASQERVQSIPYVLVYKDGQIVHKMLGYRPYEQLKEDLEPYL